MILVHVLHLTPMTAPAVATLINLLAYITGIALYAMLLVMLLGVGRQTTGPTTSSNKLPLATAVLGLMWTLGAFVVFGLEMLGRGNSHTWIQWLAFTALGGLPAVVVHSVLRQGEELQGSSLWLTGAAYSLSIVACALHFFNALTGQAVPSHIALHLLTFGFGGLIVMMLLLTRRELWWRSAGWVIALAVFAVSASHLSHHEGDNYVWWVELIGHHSSLPLALVILYQDYRFALADLFLKRALSLLSIVTLAAVLYFLGAVPLLAQASASLFDPRVTGVLLAMWVITALLYPVVTRYVHWFVDAIILQRADYEQLLARLSKTVADAEDPEKLLDKVCQNVAQALTAHNVIWQESDTAQSTVPLPRLNFLRHTTLSVMAGRREQAPLITAVIPVPTTDAPMYQLLIGSLEGGRRLLSDDLAMLEAVALLAARRIDAMRVTHERYAHELREQEMTTLATEAELRALRAQLNPHFLFNALTTIGYLVQEAPDRAVQTLLRLTGLLRGVLRRSEGEFCTLGEEIELICDYLDIEQARFEDRLRVSIDVPASLCALRIPALLLQPLVENAIKHGIAPLRAGGEVSLQARLDAPTRSLHLTIKDTGAGANPQLLRQGNGIGLANVERRLRVHFDDRATMHITTATGQGMTILLTLPLQQTELDQMATEAFVAHSARRNG